MVIGKLGNLSTYVIDTKSNSRYYELSDSEPTIEINTGEIGHTTSIFHYMLHIHIFLF